MASPLLTPRQKAMLAFAVKLTKTPGQMRKEDVELLRAAGLSDPDILDTVEVVSYFNYINRVADGLGIDPEPDWK